MEILDIFGRSGIILAEIVNALSFNSVRQGFENIIARIRGICSSDENVFLWPFDGVTIGTVPTEHYLKNARELPE
ncbi:MAG: hypothetical protein LBK41_06230 [Clostridiales bacterium]|jgi:hypothetical protein|nr:hypothetical protein [Clostridiales bacterium]